MGTVPDDLFYTHLDSPVGPLLVAGNDGALHFLSFASGSKAFGPRETWIERGKPFAEVKAQLDAYFAGRLTVFDLPLVLHGTAFQKREWLALADIPYGERRTYGWMAAKLGRPAASRAVGAANGANPIPIILPCHRLVGANGSLTGFGGGIERKHFLLDLEARVHAA